MAPVRFMASGPWGSEPVPTCTTAAAVGIASALFTRIMSGEIDILGCTGVDGAPGLPAITDDNRDAFIEGSAAAWRMVQERARRHVDRPASGERDAVVAEIARLHLRFGSLARVNGDDRDFREVGAEQAKAALDAAYAAGMEAAKVRVIERAPDCATARVATVAGIIAHAVMAGDMDLVGPFPDSVNLRLPQPTGFSDLGQHALDLAEGHRVAGLMISARARASARTPALAAISAAEAAMALTEDALDDVPDGADLPDAHATLASLRDTLRAGLAPLHAAEGQAPHGAGPAAAGVIPLEPAPFQALYSTRSGA